MSIGLERNLPKYKRVADKMISHLVRQGIEVGGYLPTELVWAKRFRVNRLTIRRALSELEQDCVISPVIAKRRKFIGKPKSAMDLIGCVGQGTGADGEDTFRNMVWMRLFEHLVLAFQQRNMYLAKILVEPGATRLPELAYSGTMKCLLTFQTLPPDWTKDVQGPIVKLEDYYNPPPSGLVLALDGIGVSIEAVRYLASHGHRRIALAHHANPFSYPFYDDVITGYRRGVHLSRLESPVYFPMSLEMKHDPVALADVLRRLFAESPDIDAFLLATSDDAPVVVAALNALGMTVPERVSLVTIGGTDPDVVGLRPTRFANDYAAIARCVCEYVCELMHGRIRNINKVVIKHYALVEGTSVADRGVV